MTNSHHNKSKGFTLIEMLVATALFTVVMTVSVSTLIAMIDANRKAQAVQSVMNNLNIALDGMVRSIRMGTRYHCGSSGTSWSKPQDCTDAQSAIAFEAFGGTSSPNDQWIYWLEEDAAHDDVGRIYRSKDGGLSDKTPITAPEVNIESFDVYVRGAEDTLFGSASNDTTQPYVTLVIKGVAGTSDASSFSALGSKAKVRTEFQVQAAATQRLLDL